MFFFRRYIKSRKIPTTFYSNTVNDAPLCTARVTGRMREGDCFQISGFIPMNCERFAIHLVLDNNRHDVALRINPRFPQNYVVRNACINSIWGISETASELPFVLKRAKDFVIQILITNDRYMISLNGYHFAKFNHRICFRTLGYIEVYGDVSNIRIDRRGVTRYPERSPKSKAKCIRMSLNREIVPFTSMPSFGRISFNEKRLKLPYYGLLSPKSLGYGKQLRFEGRIKLLPTSFVISLQAGQNIWPHPIVTFHICCRFARHRDYVGRNVVTKNAWYNGAWTKEDVSELTTNLRPAKKFSIVIVRGLSSYEVFVNKKFITKFRFCVDPDVADTVYVIGDIKLWDVVLEDYDVAELIY